jgi:hypothetical protein
VYTGCAWELRETGSADVSERAEEFRARARRISRSLSTSDDAHLRSLSHSIAQSYEMLARNEEWLEGEVAPYTKEDARKRVRLDR